MYAKRQAGSALKPIIYAAALDKGYTLSTIIIDEPTEFKWPGGDWNPQNYDNEFSGPTTFRNGLCFSKNVVTVKILQDIGIDYARRYARKMGIVSPIPRNLSVGLGSADISPLELTCAYAVFANQGYKISPIFIKKILTFDGNVLEENSPSHIPTFTSFPILEKLYNLEDKDLADILQIPPGAISRQTAYIMTDLLMSVISDGTGRVVKPIGRPCAGKT